MEEDERPQVLKPSPQRSAPMTTAKCWTTDPSITKLSETLFNNLQVDLQKTNGIRQQTHRHDAIQGTNECICPQDKSKSLFQPSLIM